MNVDPVFCPNVYNNVGCIRIVNKNQAAYYWANHCVPKDIYPSTDKKTGEPTIVYIFSKQETQDTGVYDSWCRKKQEEIDCGE